MDDLVSNERAGAAEPVADESALRALYPAVSDLAARKCIDHLDAHCRSFIALSPFVCIGTSRADGGGDVSPKGDAPGFVEVLDAHTLLIPDRVGNNRLDSLSNITVNPDVGLLFLIPGVNETLRVNGRGRIVRDSALMQSMAVNGKAPTTGLLVEVREAFLHCAKALVRSKLWAEDYKVERSVLPPLGKIIRDQVEGASFSAEEAEERIQESLRDRLY